MTEQPFFAGKAAAVAGQRAVGADDAVTRDDDTDGIGAIGEAYGANRGRTADSRGELGVGDCAAAGNGAQSRPHFFLKRCAEGVDGEIVDGFEIAFEVAADGLAEAVGVGSGLQRVASGPVLFAQVLEEFSFGVGPRGRAERAVLVGDDEHFADGRREAIDEQCEGLLFVRRRRFCGGGGVSHRGQYSALNWPQPLGATGVRGRFSDDAEMAKDAAFGS